MHIHRSGRRGALAAVCLAGWLTLLGPLAQAQSMTPTPNPAIASRVLLQTQTSWDGTPMQWPSGPAETTVLEITIAPGGDTGWHTHPMPNIGVLLEGTLQVRLPDGRERVVRAGESMAEVVNTVHRGRNVGNTPVRLIVVYVGTVGQPLSKAADGHSH